MYAKKFLKEKKIVKEPNCFMITIFEVFPYTVGNCYMLSVIA